MVARLETLAFDADDTLWHNERAFRLTQEHFAALLADHAPQDQLMARLEAAERRNLGHYGFGVKGFMLSMIETALEVTEGRVPGPVIAEILAAGQEMLRAPVEVFPDVPPVIAALAGRYRLMVITKGDLLDQERKLAQSGLGDLFDAVEIVSDKTAPVYASAFARHGAGAETALMVGNSLKSDVIPAIQAGAWGVHVPSAIEWALERADPPVLHPRFRALPGIGLLPELVGWIDGA